MFTIVKGKIYNKKIMNACLLLGITLFVLVAAVTPLFEESSLNKFLQTKFDDYIIANNEQPFSMSRVEHYEFGDGFNINTVLNIANEYADLWEDYLPVKESGRQILLSIPDASYRCGISGNTGFLGIEYMQNLSEHITIVAEDISSDEPRCIVSQKVFDDENLNLGDTLYFTGLKDKAGNILQLKIAGVYTLNDLADSSLIRNNANLRGKVYVDDNTFNKICSDYPVKAIDYGTYVSMDYSSINSKDVDWIISCLEKYSEKDFLFNTNVLKQLKEYIKARGEIKTMTMVLSLPVFALLLFFIYMVTGQIISTESTEIAILKSRGFSGIRVIGIYFYQALILGVIALIIALPLSYLLCALVSGADGFISFNSLSFDGLHFQVQMLLAALAAMAVSIIVIILPVFGYSKNTVVNVRGGRIEGMKGGIIHRFYLDILLCAVFLYLTFNYNRQKQILSEALIRGENIDWMMFISVALLILAFALLSIRLIRYLVSLVYYITKNILKPNLYASFLELRRRNKKRDFISVFIIFTVAMSIFEANLAATVNTMNEKRIIYDDGADIVLKERFPIGKKMDVNLKKAVRYYEEPDYGKYEALKASGLLTTKVMKAKAMLVANNSATTKLDLMAIHTKEFGEVANSIGYLNGEHYFNYLNELAKVRDGALISKNLAENYDIAIGDRLTYARDRELDGNGEKGRMYNTVTVVGIIDSFPGYSKYSYEYDANMKLKEVTNNLIVTNYASEVNFFGIYPYEVWINTANALAFNKGEAVEFINKYLADNDISTEYINSAYSDIAKKKSESMVLITNGLFSLGFMVSVITGMMGMLIYWITSFKEREMIFSVYRAMGMSKGGVSGIIINEQIFASVTAWLFGGGIGVIVSKLWVELVSGAYLPYKHNIPLKVIPDYKDMGILMVTVFGVIIVCILILQNLMKHSNMMRAIKMGED